MRDIADASISPQYSDRRLRTFPTVHGTAQGDEAWAEPQRKLKAETVILRMYFDNYSGQQFLPFVDSTVRNAIVRQLLSTDGSVAFCPIHRNQRGPAESPANLIGSALETADKLIDAIAGSSPVEAGPGQYAVAGCRTATGDPLSGYSLERN